MEARPKISTTDREYEEFDPSIEWVREPNADTLILNLPGFRKEQLKLQVTSTGNIRVSGERPLNDNKWSRFRKDIPTQSNYDVNAISAKFEKGMLFVKNPKLIVRDETAKESSKKADLPNKETPKPQKQTDHQEKVQPTEVPKPPVQEINESHAAEAPKRNKSFKALLNEPVEAAKPQSPTKDQSKPEGPVKDSSLEKQRSAKVDDFSQKKVSEVKEDTASDQQQKGRSVNGLAEPGKVGTSSSTYLKEENVDQSLQENAKVNKDKKEVRRDRTGSSKFVTKDYKKLFSGLVVEPKQSRKLLVNMIVAILSLVVLGIYAINAIRSLRQHEK